MRYFLKISCICLFSFYGCNQVRDSINDTLHPHETAVKKTENVTRSPDIKKITDSQLRVAKIIETHTRKHVEIHLDRESKKFLNQSQDLEQAENALRQLPQYAGKEIFIYEGIHFYDDGGISVMLRHPSNFKYVDKYGYKDGKWSQPTPVQLSTKDNVASRMVPLDSIRFTNAFRVAKAYNGKVLEVEGAKPVSYVYATIWNKRIRWFPTTINGSRERYSIAYNPDGSLKSFSQD